MPVIQNRRFILATVSQERAYTCGTVINVKCVRVCVRTDRACGYPHDISLFQHYHDRILDMVSIFR